MDCLLGNCLSPHDGTKAWVAELTFGLHFPHRAFFDRALALDPGNVEALVGLARVKAAIGANLTRDDWLDHFAAAEADLTRALSHAPNHARAHSVMGLVQACTNRAVQGIAECERALALDRNLADAHGFLGLAKFLLSRGEETEAHIHEALRLSPRDDNAYRWLCLSVSPSCFSAPTSKRLRGCAEASRPTEIIPSRIGFLPPHCRCSAHSTRHGPPRRLNRAIQAALRTDEVKSGLAKFAVEIDSISMGDFARLLASESERWKAIVEATGFTPID